MTCCCAGGGRGGLVKVGTHPGLARLEKSCRLGTHTLAPESILAQCFGYSTLRGSVVARRMEKRKDPRAKQME